MGYDTAGLTALSNTISNGASSCRTMLATMYESINGFAADEWSGSSYELFKSKMAAYKPTIESMLSKLEAKAAGFAALASSGSSTTASVDDALNTMGI